MTQRCCAVEGCRRSLRGDGYCGPHRTRWRRHGDPLAGPPVRSSGPDDCPLCEDLTWLLETGEHPDNVASRLGIRHNSLITHLNRHRRLDLLEWIIRERTAA